MRRKKVVNLLVGVLALATTLSACGNITGEKNETSSSGKKEELTFMAVGGGNQQAYIDMMEEVAEEFNEENEFNVEIKMEWYENEQYKTKLATLMTQNAVSDIFFTMEAGFIKDYVESGKVASLSNVLDNDTEWKNRFNEGVFTSVTFNDQIYAAPMGQESILVYYNKEIFNDNGLEVPKTWDEFKGIVNKLNDANITPVAMGTQDAWIIGNTMLSIMGGVGGNELYEGLVAGTTTWSDSRIVEAGERLQELVEIGTFPEGFLGISYDEGRDMFTSEKAAMYQMGSWETPIISAALDDEKVGVFYLPPVNDGNETTQVVCLSKSYAVSEKSEHKEAAFDFIKKLSSPEVQEKYVLECGAIPATNVEIDESVISSITLDIMKLQGNVKNALVAIDRQFGANIGGEFNNVALSIGGNENAKEKLTWLQEYAEKESQQ